MDTIVNTMNTRNTLMNQEINSETTVSTKFNQLFLPLVLTIQKNIILTLILVVVTDQVLVTLSNVTSKNMVPHHYQLT